MTMLTPCLGFDGKAEEAALFYTSLFPDGRILSVTRYPAGAPLPEGTVMTVHFSILGQVFMALNGGPSQFSPAVSLMAPCATQAELDALWEGLSEGGEVLGCGWVKDRYGLCWQVIPAQLETWFSSGDTEALHRMVKAVWTMTKLDVDALERAYRGA